MTFKKLLIVRPDAIGDVVLMIPMINTIKLNWPECDIYVLQQSYTADLFKDHPSVKSVIIDRKKQGQCKTIKDFWNYVSYIRSFKFEVVIHSFLDDFYARLMFCARIPVRIGDSQKLFLRFYLNRSVAQRFRQLTLHEVEHNLTLLRGLSQTITVDSKMNLFVQKERVKKIKNLLSSKGWLGKPLIGIHPSTGGGNRFWSPDYYRQLIQLINRDAHFQVVVTGIGDKDKQLIDQLSNGCSLNDFILLYNETSLLDLMAYTSLLTVMIGTDTGPTHIAAALNIPVLGVSPTKFVKSLRWGPWKTNSRVVGKPFNCDLVCNPYKCQLMYCIDALQPQYVYQELQALLDSDSKLYSLGYLRKNWFKHSVNIAVIFSHRSQLSFIKKWIEFIDQYQLRGMVLCLNSELEKLLLNEKSKSLIGIEIFSFLRLKQLIDLLAKYDINLIHILQSNQRLFWWFIRQIVALFIYCPPVIYLGTDFSLKIYMDSFNQYEDVIIVTEKNGD
ncbi:hypothetical protein DID75_03790 [Candidatus Marinamargulisbacteria bacterium SCGC AG-410-N11]|nr:hypothetical protein DID75_03790 [Candidatus Marinamargulisbacteria bacterium SCGC AG-410-N11]